LTAAGALGNALYRAQALAALAGHIPARLVPDMLEAAQGTTPPVLRPLILVALARHRPEPALAAARSRRIDGDRARMLAAVLPHVPAGQSEGVRAEALAAAAETSGHTRALSLVALAPFLPEDHLPGAVDAIADLHTGHDEAIAALAPHLPDHLRRQAIVVVGNLENSLQRAGALAELVAHLQGASLPAAMAVAEDLGSWRHGVAALVLERAVALRRAGDRSVALAALARAALDGADRAGCLLLSGSVGAAIRELGGDEETLMICLDAIRAVHA
jgi:hypothetical protein